MAVDEVNVGEVSRKVVGALVLTDKVLNSGINRKFLVQSNRVVNGPTGNLGSIDPYSQPVLSGCVGAIPCNKKMKPCRRVSEMLSGTAIVGSGAVKVKIGIASATNPKGFTCNTENCLGSPRNITSFHPPRPSPRLAIACRRRGSGQVGTVTTVETQ